MEKKNVLLPMYGSDDYRKLCGYKIVDGEDVKDEEGNEGIMLEFQNDFGISIDVLIGEEIHSNQPHIKDQS